MRACMTSGLSPIGTAKFRPPSSVRGITDGFTPPGTFFISFMMSVMSRRAFWARMRAT